MTFCIPTSFVYFGGILFLGVLLRLLANKEVNAVVINVQDAVDLQ